MNARVSSASSLSKRQRSFICGALSEKGDPGRELEFARELIEATVAGQPLERILGRTRRTIDLRREAGAADARLRLHNIRGQPRRLGLDRRGAAPSIAQAAAILRRGDGTRRAF